MLSTTDAAPAVKINRWMIKTAHKLAEMLEVDIAQRLGEQIFPASRHVGSVNKDCDYSVWRECLGHVTLPGQQQTGEAGFRTNFVALPHDREGQDHDPN